MLLKFFIVFLPYLNSRTLLVYYKVVARFRDFDIQLSKGKKKERKEHTYTKVTQTRGGHKQPEKMSSQFNTIMILLSIHVCLK